MPPRRLCIVAAGQPCPVAENCMGADPSLTCGPVAWEIDDEQAVGSEGGGRDAAGDGRRGRRGSSGRARADRGDAAADGPEPHHSPWRRGRDEKSTGEERGGG